MTAGRPASRGEGATIRRVAAGSGSAAGARRGRTSAGVGSASPAGASASSRHSRLSTGRCDQGVACGHGSPAGWPRGARPRVGRVVAGVSLRGACLPSSRSTNGLCSRVCGSGVGWPGAAGCGATGTLRLGPVGIGASDAASTDCASIDGATAETLCGSTFLTTHAGAEGVFWEGAMAVHSAARARSSAAVCPWFGNAGEAARGSRSGPDRWPGASS
jgi:hypothetical protein